MEASDIAPHITHIDYKALSVVLAILIGIITILIKYLNPKCKHSYREPFDSGYQQCSKCNHIKHKDS